MLWSARSPFNRPTAPLPGGRVLANLVKYGADNGGTIHSFPTAGRLAATAMALPSSPMLVRALVVECDCGLDICMAMGQLRLHSDLLEVLLIDIKDFNGRSWDAEIRPALTMIDDTSESADGAHVLGSVWRAHLPLTAVELQTNLKANNKLSSSEGEVLGILRAVQRAYEAFHSPSRGLLASCITCVKRSGACDIPNGSAACASH